VAKLGEGFVAAHQPAWLADAEGCSGCPVIREPHRGRCAFRFPVCRRGGGTEGRRAPGSYPRLEQICTTPRS
jgi:hypothetical protein